MEALNALRSKSPQTSAFARGAPTVFEGKSGLAEAVLFSGDAPEYHSPDGEMLRREFETLADGDSSALWKLRDVLAAGGRFEECDDGERVPGRGTPRSRRCYHSS